TVANNTYTASRVYNHFMQGDCEIKELGNKDKLLQIDSKTLGALENENGKLTGSKKELAEQLRAKIDSVGKEGQPGEQVQNVISVAMLSEGWDARNVTQIMGLRAFSSQLLCEQVVGRGLRRVSYDFNRETGMLEAEYVNIFGVPFSFLPHEGGTSRPRPARPITMIEPVEAKLAHQISFPNVLRVDTVFNTKLALDFAAIAPLEIDPADNITEASLAGVIEFKANNAAALSDIDLKTLDDKYRIQSIIFRVASKIAQAEKTGWKGDHFAFIAQLIKITKQFIQSDKIVIKSNLFSNDPLRRRILLMLNMTRIVQHFRVAIRNQNIKELTPVFDKERPIRSTGNVPTWYTTKPNDSHKKCHINFTVFDSTWEANNADILDKHAKVKSFVKNDHLGFVIKYNYRGVVKNYYPDYIVELVNGDKLVLEVKGQDSDENRIKRDFLNLWVRAINEHGGFGKWYWAVVFNSSEIHDVLENYPQFPERAYLPVEENVTEQKLVEIGQEVSNFYDISKADLLKLGNPIKMIELVIKELMSKNLTSIQQLITSTLNDDSAISLEEVQQIIYDKLDGTTPQNIEKYKNRVRNSFKGAKHLHKQSFDYLVSAEFLYDQLKVFPDGDYSPFILQYSRAVENELLRKIFIPFTNDCLDQPGRLSDTYRDDSIDPNTEQFASMIIRGRKHYTLGSMIKILSITDSYNALKNSLLLQDFNDFLIDKDLKFAKSRIFRDQLNELTRKYRNKSAHAHKMNKELAAGC
ncbi:MAG: type III restriction endonuclease subunit R, partial [Bacteroidota bacterium]